MLYDEEKYKAAPIADELVEPWRKIILDAIGIIEKRGWFQGYYCAGTHKDVFAAPVCVLGALYAATNADGLPMPMPMPISMSCSVSEERRDLSIARSKIRELIGTLDIPVWNDHPTNTKEKVLAVLGEAARSK